MIENADDYKAKTAELEAAKKSNIDGHFAAIKKEIESLSGYGVVVHLVDKLRKKRSPNKPKTAAPAAPAV